MILSAGRLSWIHRPLAAHVPDGERLYGIVVIVVVSSVLIQGSLVPTVAGLLHLPMRTREPEPWSLGVRLPSNPTASTA